MMCLAAGRGSVLITEDDVLDAHIILAETEKEMHLSLGELGLDKTTIAKQQIRETIEQATQGIRVATLRSNAVRDMSSAQFYTCLNDLVERGVCVITQMPSAGGEKNEYVIPKMKTASVFATDPAAQRAQIERQLLSR
jgi:hypothetical protein